MRRKPVHAPGVHLCGVDGLAEDELLFVSCGLFTAAATTVMNAAKALCLNERIVA
jgi:hypothetical protein